VPLPQPLLLARRSPSGSAWLARLAGLAARQQMGASRVNEQAQVCTQEHKGDALHFPFMTAPASQQEQAASQPASQPELAAASHLPVPDPELLLARGSCQRRKMQSCSCPKLMLWMSLCCC